MFSRNEQARSLAQLETERDNICAAASAAQACIDRRAYAQAWAIGQTLTVEQAAETALAAIG